MDYVDGKSTVEDQGTVEAHLGSCAACAETKQSLQSLSIRLMSDSRFEPPAELVRQAVDLFQPTFQPSIQPLSGLRKIIASLVFDTFDQPLAAGVRRAAAPPRQLLFRAGGVDVDLKIDSADVNDRITMVGQVLSNSASFLDSTPVKLESHGVIRYQTTTNLVGEFTFDEIPKDSYHLSVDLPEGQLTLFYVHRGNS